MPRLASLIPVYASMMAGAAMMAVLAMDGYCEIPLGSAVVFLSPHDIAASAAVPKAIQMASSSVISNPMRDDVGKPIY